MLYLTHKEAVERAKLEQKCQSEAGCSQAEEGRVKELDELDSKRDEEITKEVAACGTGAAGQKCLTNLYENKYKDLMDGHMDEFRTDKNTASGQELGDLFKDVFISPDGVSVDDNIAVFDSLQSMEEMTRTGIVAAVNTYIFYETVRTGGEWDYKKGGKGQYENFGNFNYGATGSTMFWDKVLYTFAGLVQNNRKAEWGHPFDPSNGYGDDPKDTDVISKGIFYYDYIYKNKNSK